ncbi:unnamed protein product, partial [Symbiodinium sp. CCMP2592]
AQAASSGCRGDACSAGNAWLQLHGSFNKATTSESTFEPVDGGMDRACRGSSAGDNRPSYYEVMPAGSGSLDACKDECLADASCKGIEYSPGRCEVWTRTEGIQASIPLNGFSCYSYGEPETTLPPRVGQWEAVDGATNRACRGASAGDNSADHYSIVRGLFTLGDCQAECTRQPLCQGVEFSPNRCEIWTRAEGIEASAPVSGYSCYRFLDPSEWRQGPGVPRSKCIGQQAYLSLGEILQAGTKEKGHCGARSKSRAAMNSALNPVSTLSLLHHAMEAAAKVEQGVKMQDACFPARQMMEEMEKNKLISHSTFARMKALLEKFAIYPDVLGAVARASNDTMRQSHLPAALDFAEALPKLGATAATRLFVKEQLLQAYHVDWKKYAAQWKSRRDRLTGLLEQHNNTVRAAARLTRPDDDCLDPQKLPRMTEFLAEVMRVQLAGYCGERNHCDPYVLSKYLKALRSVASQHYASFWQLVQELKEMSPQNKRVAVGMLAVHLSLPALRFHDSGESGLLSWFPRPAESVDIAAKLKNMAPQITYLLSHMRSGWWDPDLTAREILFQEKIFNKSFFRQLQDCEECAQVLELSVVEEEKQKCRAVRDLRNLLTGSVNSNELKMPRMQPFLDELKIGLLDANLLAAISSKDEHISWGETDFVKKAIGDILSATRHYAISNQPALHRSAR